MSLGDFLKDQGFCNFYLVIQIFLNDGVWNKLQQRLHLFDINNIITIGAKCRQGCTHWLTAFTAERRASSPSLCDCIASFAPDVVSKYWNCSSVLKAVAAKMMLSISSTPNTSHLCLRQSIRRLEKARHSVKYSD